MHKFLKDLTYPPKSQLDHPELINEICYGAVQAKSPTSLWSYISRIKHCDEGAQMWVSSEVSDDLQLSDIDTPDFAALEWPHETLEIYFEDKNLPTILAQRDKRVGLSEFLHRRTGLLINMEDGMYANDTVVHRIQVDHPDGIIGLTLSVDDINTYAKDSSKLTDNGTMGAFDMELEDDEATALSSVVMLVYKVMLFAASEGCAPRKTAEQPTKKQGGKAGFKNRPKKPRMVVEYLPRHRKERKEQAAEATGKTHEFNGRRGHWRVYRSDRYIQMKGKRQFIYPVPDKNGSYPKRQFRVVK